MPSILRMEVVGFVGVSGILMGLGALTRDFGGGGRRAWEPVAGMGLGLGLACGFGSQWCQATPKSGTRMEVGWLTL